MSKVINRNINHLSGKESLIYPLVDRLSQDVRGYLSLSSADDCLFR